MSRWKFIKEITATCRSKEIIVLTVEELLPLVVLVLLLVERGVTLDRDGDTLLTGAE